MRNREVYKWNPVYNKLMEIKDKYKDKVGKVDYHKGERINEFGAVKETSFIERWIDELGEEQYINLFDSLQTNQLGSKILIRYGRYSSIASGQSESRTFRDFWDMYDGFYRECRSIIIDVEKEVIVLSPYPKFFSLNEVEETSLSVVKEKLENAEKREYTNKLDGSMQCAAFYDEDIVLSGTRTLDTSISWRVQMGYDYLNNNKNYVKMLKENKDLTFMFEHISIQDKHLVEYSKEDEGMYLIGIRENKTGKVYDYDIVEEYSKKYNVKMTEVYNLTLEEVLEKVKVIKSYEMEGFVLNVDGLRVKIKGDDYVYLHRVFDYYSSVNLIIRKYADDEVDDLLSKSPETMYPRIMKVINRLMEYEKDEKETIKKYVSMLPKGTKKEVMIFIDSGVIPKEYIKYVRTVYLGRDINIFKDNISSSTPHYKNIEEMRIPREDVTWSEEEQIAVNA